MATLATETWTGTTGAAWPAQWTVGWQTTFGTIQANAGRLTTSGAAWDTSNARITSLSATNTEVLVTFTLSSVLEHYPGVSVRASATNLASDANLPASGYTVVFGAAWGDYGLDRSDGTNKARVQTAFITWTANTAYKLRLRAVGSQVQARVWLASAAEPSTWGIDYTDGSALGAGTVRFNAQQGGATTPVKFITFDDLTVTDGATAAVRTGAATAKAAATATRTSTRVRVGTATAEAAAAEGSVSVPETGRVIDRWNGSALVRVKVERWNGSALVTQKTDI
jgi:hypothetical protein